MLLLKCRPKELRRRLVLGIRNVGCDLSLGIPGIYFFKIFIYLFLEREKGKEKERERNISV